MSYQDWKMYKDNMNNEEYSRVAEWCNQTGEYHIEDKGEYFAVVENEKPTDEDIQSNMRSLRDEYLAYYDYTQLADAPYSEEEKKVFADYRQYLRDYTKSENWWLEAPKSFEEWQA